MPPPKYTQPVAPQDQSQSWRWKGKSKVGRRRTTRYESCLWAKILISMMSCVCCTTQNICICLNGSVGKQVIYNSLES